MNYDVARVIMYYLVALPMSIKICGKKGQYMPSFCVHLQRKYFESYFGYKDMKKHESELFSSGDKLCQSSSPVSISFGSSPASISSGSCVGKSDEGKPLFCSSNPDAKKQDEMYCVCVKEDKCSWQSIRSPLSSMYRCLGTLGIFLLVVCVCLEQ